MNIYSKYDNIVFTVNVHCPPETQLFFYFQKLKRGSSIIIVHVVVNLASEAITFDD